MPATLSLKRRNESHDSQKTGRSFPEARLDCGLARSSDICRSQLQLGCCCGEYSAGRRNESAEDKDRVRAFISPRPLTKFRKLADRARRIGYEAKPLCAAAVTHLNGRARRVAVRAINTAIPVHRPEQNAAAVAFIEVLACVGRHPLPLRVPALRASDDRIAFHRDVSVPRYRFRLANARNFQPPVTCP